MTETAIQPKFQAERFKRLIEAVETRPSKRFGIGWRDEKRCGTVCCAVGSYIELSNSTSLEFWAGTIRQVDSTETGVDAAAAEFGIRHREAIDLFCGEESTFTKLAVLARLRAFYKSKTGSNQ